MDAELIFHRPPAQPAIAVIGCGGNVGDVPAAIDAAVTELENLPRTIVRRRSSLYRTKAVGVNAGADFVNAAVVVETQLAPLPLLDELQRIERLHGRGAHAHWTPRSLDLDLIAFGNLCGQSARLTLPHPHAWYRRFVLDPVVEIAANILHPPSGSTFTELRCRLLPRPLPIATECQPPSATAVVALIPAKFRGDVEIVSVDDAALVFSDEFPTTDRISSRQPRIFLPRDESARRRTIEDVLTAALG